MAVERMKLMNGIFFKKDVTTVLREIILQGSLHISDANKASDFTIKAFEKLNNKLDDKITDYLNLSPFETDQSLDKKRYKEIFRDIFQYLDLKGEENFDGQESSIIETDISSIDQIYAKMQILRDQEYKAINEGVNIQLYVDFLEYFANNGADQVKIQGLKELKYMKYTIGTLSPVSYKKLKANYENIQDIVLHAGSTTAAKNMEREELVMVFSPKSKLSSSENLLKSLNFTPLDLPEFEDDKEDTFQTRLLKMKEFRDGNLEKKEKLSQEKEKFAEKYSGRIRSLYYSFKVTELSRQIEGYIAQSDHFFFIAGFIPVSKIKSMEEAIAKAAPDSIVTFDEMEKDSAIGKVPTKLKNNKLFAPFETLVNMYSVPSYHEHDPTPFFAITYMLFFGMMFGDVGQGLILFIAGILLSKKIPGLAGIASRIGISSILFGFLYGSIFGTENILPSLLIRPMEDVNSILIASIGIGVVVILMAYMLGFSNLIKRKEKAELLFDKNGIAGLLFYLAFLGFILNMFLGKKSFPEISPFINIITIGIMLLSAFILFMKPALSEKILAAEETTEKANGVERGFELFETIMSFFTNTLSFIRLGAFAINHVGLFMAFHSLGQMTGSVIGNAIMIVLGNIVIIVLEGLIVSIQSIRLEYYELFSRYYKGEGISYDPMNIKKY